MRSKDKPQTIALHAIPASETHPIFRGSRFRFIISYRSISCDTDRNMRACINAINACRGRLQASYRSPLPIRTAEFLVALLQGPRGRGLGQVQYREQIA